VRAFAIVRTALERILAVVCIGLMFLLALLVIVAVFMRKFGMPFGWYDEVAAIMLAWITYYGAAFAALKRGHLGFPNLVAAMPKWPRLAFVLFSTALVLGFFGLVTWFGTQVVILLQGDTLISLPWVPISFSQSVVPIGAALFVIAELLVLPDRIREALHEAPPVDPERAIVEGAQ